MALRNRNRLESADIGAMGYMRHTADSNCLSTTRKYVSWKLLSMLALAVNVGSAICMMAAYTNGQWEIIIYSQEAVTNFANSIGEPVRTSETTNYFLVFYNKTSPVAFDNQSSEEMVTIAISKTIISGIFKLCDTVDKEVKTRLKLEGTIWLTQNCYTFSSIGESGFARSSPEYSRHSITRMSQTCMFVSAICLITTLITGIFSLAFGQLLLCVVVSTVSIAAAIYQMFVAISVQIRMKSGLSPLTYEAVTLTHSAADSKPGASVSCIWVACVLSLFTGILWIAVYRQLNKHVKILESENVHGAYERYNYCCAHIMNCDAASTNILS